MAAPVPGRGLRARRGLPGSGPAHERPGRGHRARCEGGAMTEPRVAVISGGSRGLGGALAQDLLERGWTVATFSRKASPLVEQLQREDADGGRFYWEALDSNEH